MILAVLALTASLVLDGGDIEQAQRTIKTLTVESPASSFTICTSPTGQIAFCSPSGEMFCWDSRASSLRSCVDVRPWKPRTGRPYVWYVLVTAAGSGWDILTTGISIHRGASEQNPLLPTEEIRAGAKVLGGLAISGALWFVDHVLHHPNAAKWMAFIADGIYFGVGVHNLTQGHSPAQVPPHP